jgi:hypothetical protein
MVLRTVTGRTAKRPSRWRAALVTFIGVICGALLLGLFGSAAGAAWSLAVGFGAGVGALYGGIIIFVLGLFLVPINSRMGTTSSLGMMAVVLFTLEMLVGLVVWGVRAAI